MAVTRPSTIKSKTTPKTTSQDLSDCIDCFCNYCDSCHKCYCSEPPAGPPDFVQRTLSLDRRHQHLRRPTTTNRFDSVASSFTYLGYNIIRDNKNIQFSYQKYEIFISNTKTEKVDNIQFFTKIILKKYFLKKNIFLLSLNIIITIYIVVGGIQLSFSLVGVNVPWEQDNLGFSAYSLEKRKIRKIFGSFGLINSVDYIFHARAVMKKLRSEGALIRAFILTKYFRKGVNLIIYGIQYLG